jgi:AraC family transcriptional regulator of arabinose operon
MKKENVLDLPGSETGDLFANSCGICAAKPLESFGPAIKPHYLILYVFSGSGVFSTGGKKFQVKKEEGFIITPNELASYHADKKDPWTYAYVGFGGKNADRVVKGIGLAAKNPIFKSDKANEIRQIMTEMVESNTYGIRAELMKNGLLSVFLSIVSGGTITSVKNDGERAGVYVRKATEFIRNNYCNPIKITEVADYVCINRSYLYTLFMNEIDISPHQYLSNYRIDKASELLKTTSLSIEGVALSCGYMDSLVFTKAFKQMKGVSPSLYRKSIHNGEAK